MPIQFKSKLSSSVANETFVDKTIDDIKKGKLSFYKVSPTEPEAIDDIQQYVNDIAETTGITENDANKTNYANQNFITNGDSQKTTIEKLDAQAKVNADDIDFNSDHINELADTQGTTKGDPNAKVYATNYFILDGDSQKTAIEKFDAQMKVNADEIQAIEDSVGAASGIAPLNASTKIDALYLPSYVDDVEEYADLASFPVTGETGKIYVALDTNKTYRWSGSTYVEISPSDVNSVNSQTGIVVLDSDDIAEGSSFYYTERDTKANLDLLTRQEGKFYYATDEQKGYLDNGTELIRIGSGGFNEIDTKANLDLLVREQGKIYYATDEDAVYTDDGTQLNLLGGAGIPTLAKGSLVTSDGANNGELTVGTDGQFLSALSTETSGLQWQDVLQVPSGGTTGQILTKTATGYEWQDASGGAMQTPTSVIATTGSYTVPVGTTVILKASVSEGRSLTIDGTTVMAGDNLSWSTQRVSTSPAVGNLNGYYHILSSNANSTGTKVTAYSNSTAYNRSATSQAYTLPEGTVIAGNAYKLIEVY